VNHVPLRKFIWKTGGPLKNLLCNDIKRYFGFVLLEHHEMVHGYGEGEVKNAFSNCEAVRGLGNF